MDLLELTAVELSGKIKAGEATVMEAAAAVLKRIKEKDGVYRCYITVDEDAVMERAKEIQIGRAHV